MKNILLLITLCFTTSIYAEPEVLHTSEHGFIVVNKQVIKADKMVVWQALVDDVDSWWPKDHSWWKGTFSIDKYAGGCFCERSGDRSAEHMRISFVDPGNTLRMTGGLGPLQKMGMYGALDWQFDQTEKETTVTLSYAVSGVSQSGYESLAPIVAKVQGQQLEALVNYLLPQTGD